MTASQGFAVTLHGSGQLRWIVDRLWIFFILSISTAYLTYDQLGITKACWFAADAAAVVSAWLFRDELLRVIRRQRLWLFWPLLGATSALWSFSPFISFYHSMQLLMTMTIGLLLAAYTSLERITQLVFYSMALAAAIAVIGAFAGHGATGLFGEWLGGFPHKNNFGAAMATLAGTALCLLLQGWRPAISISAIVLAIVLVVLSRSATAKLCLAVSMLPVFVFMAYRLGSSIALAAFGLMAIGAAGLIAAIDFAGNEVLGAILGSVEKETTLTGRTVLWNLGIDAFWSRPILGFGYKGYWNDPAGTGPALVLLTTGQGLWFFHNNFLEVAVAFGFMGPVLLFITLLAALLGALKRLVLTGDVVYLWPVLMVLQLSLMSMSENALIQNHSYDQVLIVAAAAARARGGAPLTRRTGFTR